MRFFRTLPRWGAALAAAAPLMALSLPLAHAQTGAAPAGMVQVYADALKNNAVFRARLAQFEATNQTLQQAKGQLLPQVGARASYDYVHEEIEGQFFGRVDVENEDDFDRSLLGVQVTQALYRPDLWLSRDQAEIATAQGRFQLDAEEDNLLVTTAETYFSVLGAQDLASFTKAERDALARQLEQVRTRYDAGLTTEADLRAAEAQQSTAAAGALQADTGLQAAYGALEVIAGKSHRALKQLPEEMTLAPPEPANVDTWVQRARTQNLAVLAARSGLRIAELEVEKARKRRWPRLDAAAGAFRLDNGGGLQGEREEIEGRVGVSLTMPLYAGGSLDALVAESEARLVAAQALFDAAAASASLDAQLAFFRANNGLSTVPARQAALTAARAAESSTAAGFDAGTRTSADVLLAIQSRFEAEREYAAARYQYMLDMLRLKRAAGSLANADLIRYDRLLRVAAKPAATAAP